MRPRVSGGVFRWGRVNHLSNERLERTAALASILLGILVRMARWGIDELDEELARVRVLRADGVGLATTDEARLQTFGAALEQFEQLLRSAMTSPPTTAPLPLFYALSQAGRAIAAACHPDAERWSIHGHGLKGPRGSYPNPVGEAVIRTDDSDRGAYRIVSEATGSSWKKSWNLRLGDLWASLPHVETANGMGESSPRPIQPKPQSPPSRASWTFRAWVGSEADRVGALEQRYPALAKDGHKFVIEDDRGNPDWVIGAIFTPLETPRLQETAETHLGESTLYIRPAQEGEASPSILMTWWAVLFALSQLARYEPATWMHTITPDRSALTVPIESALRQAQRTVPRLVLHALTGRWH